MLENGYEIYIDLENLLKEKKVSKRQVCLRCNLQPTQLNNYCKNKIVRVDLSILGRLCAYLSCMPNDILKVKKE